LSSASYVVNIAPRGASIMSTCDISLRGDRFALESLEIRIPFKGWRIRTVTIEGQTCILTVS